MCVPRVVIVQFFQRSHSGHSKRQVESTPTVPKVLFLNIEFEGDTSAEIIKNRQSRPLMKTFHLAKL